MVTKSSVSLLKKSVDDLLFQAHEFLAILETARFAPDVDDGAVMQDAIRGEYDDMMFLSFPGDEKSSGCQRRFKIVGKRRRNFVVFRRRESNKIKRFLAEKEC